MKLYKLLYDDFEELFVGYSALAVILSSCLGSVAVMLILMNGHDLVQMLQLSAVVVATMWYNTSILAQMKSKFVFNSLIVSLFVSVALILVNLFAL